MYPCQSGEFPAPQPWSAARQDWSELPRLNTLPFSSFPISTSFQTFAYPQLVSSLPMSFAPLRAPSFASVGLPPASPVFPVPLLGAEPVLMEASTQTFRTKRPTLDFGCQTTDWASNQTSVGTPAERSTAQTASDRLDERILALQLQLADRNPGPEIYFYDVTDQPLSPKTLAKRNERYDITYILKVKRYWRNPAAISPNIFKKRIEKVVKGKHRLRHEELDLSRLRTNFKRPAESESDPQEDESAKYN